MKKYISEFPFWQRISSSSFFAFYLILIQALNFAFIYYYCQRFYISRRLVIINMAVSFGLLAILVIMTGIFIRYCQPIKTNLPRRIIAVIYGAWTAVLGLLYVFDLFANSWWGNNVNYQLAYQHLIRHGNFFRNTLSLSAEIYLSIWLFLIFIFAFHFLISKHIVRGLEEWFLPDRPLSLFRNRKRSFKTIAAVSLWLIFYCFFVYALNGIDAKWAAGRDPLTGFFRTHLYDLKRDDLTRRLRLEEPRVRADYPKSQTFDKKNVVFIVVDSLRADHMQIYGYRRPTTPFLQSLLKDGKLKKAQFATSTCAESICGILSTLSSKNFRAQTLENFKINDLLQDLGYKTYFVLSGDHEYYGLKQSYGSDLTYYFDGASSKIYSHWDDDRVIFEGLEKVPVYDGNPAFFQFHLMSAHFSGVRQEQFHVYQPFQIERDWDMLMKNNYDQTALVNNYDNGVVQSDAMIQKIFEQLRQKNYLQNSIVVILSDHGEGLGDRDQQRYGHVNSLYQEFISIPLLIYDDSETKYPDLEFATQIDVAPTVLARLGLQIPSSWQGNSLFNFNEEVYTFHQTRAMNASYAVIYRTKKVVYKYHYRIENLSEELYELISDPAEKYNLITTADEELVKRLRTKLNEYLSES